MRRYLILKVILLFVFFSANCHSQELPPILKFDADTYRAGNQNWMISQDRRQFIYVANNAGLLEFNGAEWKLHPSPNETIIRSVNVIDDVIYTGCYMEYGFWKRNKQGLLSYTSLSNRIKSKILDDEQFWNIFSYDQWVVYQSLSRIHIYDTHNNSFKFIDSDSGILKAFKTDESLYYQTGDGDIFEIVNGSGQLIASSTVLQNKRIVNIFKDSGGLLLQTQTDGFYRLQTGTIQKFVTEADNYLANTTIYNSLQLADGSFALGSISNGIFILSANGKLIHHITQSKGLANNTILSLFEDRDRNLWIGLDNGINCINIASPIKSFFDNSGILGTVYASIIHDGKLYVGTNQGLFYKPAQSGGEFEFVKGTKGQVWSLFAKDGTLFCGHDLGTFIVEGAVVKRIYSDAGTWKFVSNPKNAKQLIQGNYTGLSILEFGDTGWTFKSIIPGFKYSSRYFEILGNSIYVSHEYKGVYRLTMNEQLAKVVNVQAYKHPAKGKNSSLIKYNNTLLYASKVGIFKLDAKTHTFKKDSILSKVIDNDEYTSGKMIVDQSNKLWIFTKHQINYFTLGTLSTVPKLNTIPIPSSLTNSMSGYENISNLGESSYLVGTTDGYYILNTSDLRFNTYKINITDVTKNKLNGPAESIVPAQQHQIKYKQNNIAFSYAVAEYNKYVVAEYQYQLEGLSDEWSDWSDKSAINFKNLPYGNYTFNVRARIGNAPSENTESYSFSILRPWYATYTAILIVLRWVVGVVLQKTAPHYQYLKDCKNIQVMPSRIKKVPT